MRPEQAWFSRDRFGLFIHWGLYALPARHEWVMSRERIPVADYERYAHYFHPDLFDPRSWAEQARAAGMRYAVLTTKHHDGFCLFDSALTDYTVMNTPYGRDAVAEFVAAFRDAGLRVGFYHSLLDWHHPDFTIDVFHPRRDDPDAAGQNGSKEFDRYRDYLHGQVRELLTSYGTIDYLFFDFSYPDRAYRSLPGKGREDWGSAELLRLVRQLQPNAVVNDRLDLSGDLVTPEQYQPSGPMVQDGRPVPWEACQTLTGSWGYDRDNLDRKPVDLLLRMLIDGVAKGGNLLLNVGPTGRGEFDPAARRTLAGIGEWMRLHSRAIHGAGPADVLAPPDTRYTGRGDRLYLHLFAWPLGAVHLPGLADRVAYAQLLNDGSEVPFSVSDPDEPAQNTHAGGQPAGTLTLQLPTQPPPVVVPVIELFLR